MMKQYRLVIDYTPGPHGSWDAHLENDPEMAWSSSDVHTLLAAVSRDLTREER